MSNEVTLTLTHSEAANIIAALRSTNAGMVSNLLTVRKEYSGHSAIEEIAKTTEVEIRANIGLMEKIADSLAAGANGHYFQNFIATGAMN